MCPKILDQELADSWIRTVWLLHCRRSGLCDLTLPDVDLTNKLVGELPDGDKKLVQIHLSGGITTRAQASIWSDGDAICPYCLDRDTIPHRVLTCSGVAHIREAFPELSRLPPDLAKCPWVPIGDHIEGWRRLVFSRPYPSFPSTLVPDGEKFFAYTDGSAFGEDAGYAVIQDMLHSDQERVRAAERFSSTRDWPDCMKVVCTGKSPLRATIQRAELLAITLAISLGPRVVVHSDSKYAISWAEKLQNLPEPTLYLWCDNYDLLILLSRAILLWPGASRSIELIKIKSHQNYSTDPLQAYRQFGNNCADLAAKAAVSHDDPVERLIKQNILQEKEDAISFWRPVYLGLAAIGAFFSTHTATIIEPTPEIVSTNHIQGSPPSDWTPLNCTPINDDWQSASTWGASYNAVLIAWTSSLLWPPNSHEASSAEVSWAELLVSFRLATKCPIPIPCAIPKGTYITEGIHYVPTLEARPLGAEVKAFVNSLRTLTTITGAQIMPWDQTKKIKLVRFGRGLQVQGLSTRPFFPHQESVQSLLTNYFTCANGSISMSTALNLAKIPPSLMPHNALLRRDGLIRSSMRLRTQVSRHYE